MTVYLTGPHIEYKIINNKYRQYIEIYDYKNKIAFKLLDGEICEEQNKLPLIILKEYEIIPWPFKDYEPKRDLHMHMFTSETLSLKPKPKKVEKSCSNCEHHTYDWFDDGDEFEVCLKNNDLKGPCEDYEEL